MKGVVFTEFMEMIETKFGLDMVDELIDEVQPASRGAYTSVATYPYEELVAYVLVLSKRTGVAVPQLVHTFGLHLANSFANKFGDFFRNANNTLEFLKKVDNHIHVEVRKLYPDAELPKFHFEQPDEHSLILYYESTRSLPDLAHGLIEGCAKYYGDTISLQRQSQVVNGVAQEKFEIALIH